jgi:hypothetical protein
VEIGTTQVDPPEVGTTEIGGRALGNGHGPPSAARRRR